MATSKGNPIPVKGTKITTNAAGKPTTASGHAAPAAKKAAAPAAAPNRPAPARTQAQSTAVQTRAQTNVANRAPVGRGFEDADKDAYAIPFLFILQDNSPQLDTVEGAEAGMIFNSSTNELATEVTVVPALYRRRFVRWGARDAGGGFKGEVLPSEVDAMLADETAKQIPQDEGGGIFIPGPDGQVKPKRDDQLRDTRSHYVVVNGAGAVIAMASTQVKKSKNWMTAMRAAGGDMWDHAYTLSSTRESNDKGKWYGWVIQPAAGEVDEGTKDAAASLYEAVMGGKAQADYEHAEGSEAAAQ